MPRHAPEKLPVDVCYTVTDLKYNAVQGVKICEVQQAALSLFNGDAFRNSEEKSIHKKLLHALSLYNQNGWVVASTLADQRLVSTLASSTSWRTPKDLIALFSDPDFKLGAKQPVKNPHDLAAYQGFLYCNWSQLHAIYDFETRLPSMIVMDKSSFPFWIDKYRMAQLFAEDDRLATIKPRWGNYKKRYSKSLADKIASDLGGDNFVIKPRGQFLGKGVIIAQRSDLAAVLQYITTKSGPLANSSDRAYSAWKNDQFDSFIVEEFIASDLITLPHMGNKKYQPTMRVAFLLVYNQHHHRVHFLGEYWKTPEHSMDEPGDFMQKNKDICEPPYYKAVDAKTKRIVRSKLNTTLPILHCKMIQFSNSQKEFLAPAAPGSLQLVLKRVAPRAAQVAGR